MRRDSGIVSVPSPRRPGREPRTARLEGRTRNAEAEWRIVHDSGRTLVDWSAAPDPTRAHLGAMSAVDVLHCEPEAPPRVVVHAVRDGVLCVWPDPPAEARQVLGGELTDALRVPEIAADAWAWEVCGVRQHRAAWRSHGEGVGHPIEPPTLSVVVATRRPEQVNRTLEQLSRQTCPNLEVVLGLHGFEAPAWERDALGFPVETVRVDASEPLGVVLQRATEAASGALVSKLDDDDTYGPEHLWDLVLARHRSGAEVVGKPDEFVYLEQLEVTVRRTGCGPEQFSNWVAGGTILLARDGLDEVGGWSPVPRSVDRALLDAVLADGGRVYRTHGLGYLYHRHGHGHTWNPGLAYYLRRSGPQWPGMLCHPEFGTEAGGHIA